MKALVIDEADDTKIKTWLNWMRRLIDGCPVEDNGKRPTGGPQATVIKGELPTMAEIQKLPGRIRVGQDDSNPNAIHYFEEKDKWIERKNQQYA
jgi:hypothetical protein